MLPQHKARYRIVPLPQEVPLCAFSISPHSLCNHCSNVIDKCCLFWNVTEMKSYSMHCFGSNSVQHIFEVHPYCCVYQECVPGIADQSSIHVHYCFLTCGIYSASGRVNVVREMRGDWQRHSVQCDQ